jgi:hypothetical protein
VPPPQGHTAPATKRSQGFLDYALGKINSDNTNYGIATANAREEMVNHTIRDLYFWSNVVCLSLLGATSVSLFLVLQTQDKREIIASHLIAQLWNGRVVDRREITRRTEMYNAVVETKNATLNRAMPSPSDVDAIKPSNEVPAAVPPKEKPGKKSRVQMDMGESGSPTSPSSQVETAGLPPLSWEEKATLLDGQIQALRNTERNLKQRLNQVSQDLDQERRRNQTLKGA